MGELEALKAAYESVKARADDAERRVAELTKHCVKLEEQLAKGDVGAITNKLVNANKSIERLERQLEKEKRFNLETVEKIHPKMRELLGAELFNLLAYEETES